jgi:hypothetical protein
MIFAIAIRKKFIVIIALLLISVVNNYTFGQVKELLIHDTEDINVNQIDSTKTGVFIFIKDGLYTNSKINKFLQGLTCLETYEDIDTANFEIFLIKIVSNSAVCSNKHLKLNDYELQASFTYDPYRIVLAPTPKNLTSIWRERVDTIPAKLEEVQNREGAKSPFLSTKDHRDLLKLIRKPDHTKNYEELKKKYDDLKKQLDVQNQIIETMRTTSNAIKQYIDNITSNKTK